MLFGVKNTINMHYEKLNYAVIGNSSYFLGK